MLLQRSPAKKQKKLPPEIIAAIIVWSAFTGYILFRWGWNGMPGIFQNLPNIPSILYPVN